MLSRCAPLSFKSRGLILLKQLSNDKIVVSGSRRYHRNSQTKYLIENKSMYTNGLSAASKHKQQRTLGLVSVCYASTDVASVDNLPDLPPIPKAPLAPEQLTESVSNLAINGEPPFESIGLGGYSPVGFVQNCMEYLHVGLDIPWWTTIVIGTLCVRIIIFPLVIVAQRNAAKMNNHMPKLQEIQVKMTEARQTGNQMDAAKYGQEMMTFMKVNNVNPLKNMIVPLAQMPLFVSFFMGLRGMANVPVDSMRTGGLFWFTDLTLPDPYYLLPILTSATMWLTIEIGTDAARLSSQNLQTMRYVLRALPVIILPFTINFPGAILCYWVSTNFISLLQVGFLKIPKVRTYFNIDPLVVHNPDKLPVKPKPFIAGVKESWTNMRIAKELEERERFDDMQFQRAGRGPIIKTYKYDPTKTPVEAKKR